MEKAKRARAVSLKSLRRYCAGKPGCTEDTPFGPETLVFKVKGKIFGIVGLDESPLRLNLKCDPELAVILRNSYDAVTAGYHMNKQHWNTVTLDGSIPRPTVLALIDESYKLVVQRLSEKLRRELRRR